MKILCMYVPFCSPVSPPYSLSYLAGFLERNTNEDTHISVLDLNAELHEKEFSKEYENIARLIKEKNMESYGQDIKDIKKKFAALAKKENYTARRGEDSNFIDYCMEQIHRYKAEKIVMSVVYNSQAFFAQHLAEKLAAQGIEVLVGGPAVTAQLKKVAKWLPHEVALLEHITGKKEEMNKLDCRRITNYSLLDTSKYFTPELVIPIKTASCCYYQKCTFCTHHMKADYVEYNLEDIKESITRSQAKKVFIIDDMMHKKRLLDIAKMMKSLDVEWMCQLRPTKEFDEALMSTLYASGLRVVIWGVESGNDRVLEKMKKGTNVADVEKVLKESARAGISNVCYIMFGFPTETKEEFVETIDFLKRNSDKIDLVSTAVFGLQEEAPIFEKPAEYGITEVKKTQREKLPDKIEYKAGIGLQTEEAKLLRKKYSKTLAVVNKYPNEMNIYREHMLLVLNKKIGKK